MKATSRKSAILTASALLGCVLLVLSAAWLAAQAPNQPAPASGSSTLTVHISEIRNAEGKIRVTLFRDSAPVESREVAIDPKTLTAQTAFEKLPQGVYAVYLLHDENMSGKMEYDEMGIPLKGYGASNNPPRRPGRPGFDETNFKLDKPQLAIEIGLLYWK